ncbi:MAG: peptide deformylase, partial [Candidatus Acidiferrales bacterium]
MIHAITKWPEAVLEMPAENVTKFNESLRTLSDEMFETMYVAQGVGLAAPQIGISRRVAVIDVTTGKNPEARIIIINPEVTHSEGEQR